MHILLDQAVYDQRNLGNVALLQSAVERLTELWPDAKISVLTEAPYLLKLYCPTAYPVSVHPWQNWTEKRRQFENFHRWIPNTALQLLLDVREELWHRYPNLLTGEWRQRVKTLVRRNDFQANPETESNPKDSSPKVEEQNTDLIQAIQSADLVIATGGGYLCDADKKYTFQVFDTLERAVRLGKPAAMVGQGVGPLRDPDLRARLSKLLPALDLILIREPKIARPLLESLGVSQEKVMMTGDDAIEMAYKARVCELGSHIGVNLRLARYTEIDQTSIEKFRQALHRSARKHQAPLLALPTSSNIVEADLEYMRQILEGYENVSVDWRRYHQPLDLIRKIGRCRLVVTAAFHPALLALAQGIPVIGVFKSTYSYDKFDAIRDEFGSACQILPLEHKGFQEKLVTAIDIAWNSAENVRSDLLQAAVRQIEWGKSGYKHLYNLVTQKKQPQPA